MGKQVEWKSKGLSGGAPCAAPHTPNVYGHVGRTPTRVPQWPRWPYTDARAASAESNERLQSPSRAPPRFPWGTTWDEERGRAHDGNIWASAADGHRRRAAAAGFLANSFLLRCVELRKLTSKKWHHQFFAIYYQKIEWSIGGVCGNFLLVQSNHKVI